MSAFPVIAVVSACGGAGASVLAALLAALAKRSFGDVRSYLVDCDAFGGGVDVLLGSEGTPGPRWGEVRVRGDDLDASVLSDGLPRWGPVSFLAADGLTDIDPGALATVVSAASRAGPVVLDVPRWAQRLRESIAPLLDLVVVVLPAEVRAVTACGVLLSGRFGGAFDPARVTLVLRGSSRAVAPDSVASLLGVPVSGVVRHEAGCVAVRGLDPARTSRATRALLDELWARARAAVPA